MNSRIYLEKTSKATSVLIAIELIALQNLNKMYLILFYFHLYTLPYNTKLNAKEKKHPYRDSYFNDLVCGLDILFDICISM